MWPRLADSPNTDHVRILSSRADRSKVTTIIVVAARRTRSVFAVGPPRDDQHRLATGMSQVVDAVDIGSYRLADGGNEAERIVVGLTIGMRRDPMCMNDRIEVCWIGIFEPGRVEPSRRLQPADHARDAARHVVERQVSKTRACQREVEGAMDLAQVERLG